MTAATTANVNLDSGMLYLKDVITKEQEIALLKEIYGDIFGKLKPWQVGPGGRRVQQFGFVYDYDAKNISFDAKAPPIPKLFMETIQTFADRCDISKINQIIVNEYQSGQGITPHSDHPKFGDTILSLRLSSGLT